MAGGGSVTGGKLVESRCRDVVSPALEPDVDCCGLGNKIKSREVWM